MPFDWLDIITTILGLLYIWLEYRAHIALWVVGIVMPALDVWLYYTHGLYGDAGMAVYYTLAACYGLCIWKFKKTRKLKQSLPIIHMPRRLYLPAAVFFFVAWAAIYYVLITWTDSTVPVLDSFTNALSFVGMWALARKYLEQWFFWIAVDAVCTFLYIQKGIPFKAGLYGLYVVIAVLGYFKWKKMMPPIPYVATQSQPSPTHIPQKNLPHD
jgi:nicotinamide mononucleotide transporter